ncbi:MAG: hypothetical protein AVO38_05585 [delta proteobacterium ML8_D]|nr:MAG: hypothetical protein AVO38_05585 [delta proteobacterium ML8_D]
MEIFETGYLRPIGIKVTSGKGSKHFDRDARFSYISLFSERHFPNTLPARQQIIPCREIILLRRKTF